MTNRTEDSDPTVCVEVRFLDRVICSMQTSDRGRAETYAEVMRRQYWGAQVTVLDGPCEGPAQPLPDNSALWPLTVK